MLTLSNISKIYKNKHRLVHALDDINLSFPNKGLVFILGESGAGKSTLLNLISLQEKQTKGKIYIEGKDTSSLKKNKLGILRSSYFGIIFQDLNLINDFNVFQNIAIAKQIKHEEVNKEEIVQLFNKLQLDESLLYEKVDNLSGGQRQRIAIIRALIKDPKVIICDEPTGSLDSKNATSIFDILKEISKEKLVIVVSHNELLANKYADRIIKLELGHIVDDIDKNNSSLSKIDESDITNIDIDKLKTTHLNFKTTIKLAFNSFKKNIVRLIFAMFTTFISLAVFSSGMTLYAYNEEEVLLKQAAIDGFTYLKLIDMKDAELASDSNKYTIEDVNYAEKIFDNKIIIGNYTPFKNYINWSNKGLEPPRIAYCGQNNFNELSFDYIGDYPNENNEVGISDQTLKNYYRMYNLNFNNDYESYVGSKINIEDEELIISMIFSSNSFTASSNQKEKIGLQNTLFLSKDKYELYCQEYYSFSDRIFVLTNQNDLYKKANEFYQYINSTYTPKNRNLYETIYNNSLLSISNFIDVYGLYFSIIGSIFVFAAIISFVTFIISIIQKNKNNIRILKSLGMNSSDINIIYTSSISSLAIITFIISLIISVIINSYMNMTLVNQLGLDFNPINFSYLINGMLLLAILIITIVTTLLALKFQIKNENLRK